jgi:cystathionine gamma-lyase
MTTRKLHRDTEIVHAGFRKNTEPGAFLNGPQFSSTFTTPGEPADHALTYGRFHNPTWTAWESALGELEGGEAVAFGSGMAAVSAALGVTVKPGDTIVLPADSYYAVRRLAGTWLEPMGVTIRLAPTRGSAAREMLEGAAMVWLETPSNPLLDVCDIAAVVKAARSRGVVVVVDNTTATPYLQQPLALGATYVVASDTKAISGHSDVILGHVATADPSRLDALRAWRTHHGAIPGPMEVWLAHRSLPTLPVRLTRQCGTALALATRLAGRKDVAAVHYPGLPSHPGHAIARQQMRDFGSIVSFDLGTRERADGFLSALTLVRQATSFGGVHSMAERRARWGSDAIGEGFIRFSVGCEAPEDILADVEQALSK